jgi:hypothetical protein
VKRAANGLPVGGPIFEAFVLHLRRGRAERENDSRPGLGCLTRHPVGHGDQKFESPLRSYLMLHNNYLIRSVCCICSTINFLPAESCHTRSWEKPRRLMYKKEMLGL